MPSAKALCKALRKFTDGEPDLIEQLAAIAELQTSSDRAIAVLAPIQAEEALQHALALWFRELTSDEYKGLFDMMQPLSSFSAKIRVCYAMGIIGERTRDDLDILRTIRNSFAHSGRTISFDTDEVAAACAHLHAPSLWPKGPNDKVWPPTEARKQYRSAAQTIAHILSAAERPTRPSSLMP